MFSATESSSVPYTLPLMHETTMASPAWSISIEYSKPALSLYGRYERALAFLILSVMSMTLAGVVLVGKAEEDEDNEDDVGFVCRQ